MFLLRGLDVVAGVVDVFFVAVFVISVAVFLDFVAFFVVHVINIDTVVIMNVLVTFFLVFLVLFGGDVITLIAIVAGMDVFVALVRHHDLLVDSVAVGDGSVLVCLVGVAILYVLYSWWPLM